MEFHSCCVFQKKKKKTWYVTKEMLDERIINFVEEMRQLVPLHALRKDNVEIEI
jgi:hypothetical protein